MKILIVKTEAEASIKAADILAQKVIKKPNAVLGLATGGTMLNVYKNLRATYDQGGLSFKDVVSFNLDEYIGIKANDPNSYRSYMNENLFNHIDIDLYNTHLPQGYVKDLVGEAANYEKLIDDQGGLDLILLGLGKNGHIGFNEPSSSLNSATRIKKLTKNTIEANQKYFPEGKMPEYAITMGIKTILSATECLLVATGSSKTEAARKMIEGAISASCPATALQMHQKVTVILDEEAAQKLEYLEDYLFIHPNGEDTMIEVEGL